ncbi:MAG TPA: DUF4168 domain-containing protein [Acetobacteraceae bacterium]|nr:DUF4168 domain-containing protein [Acetobacteraceae bacterium]
MAKFRNAGDGGAAPGFSDETVSKVGRAAGQIALIREAYRDGLNEVDNEGEKQELGQRAEAAAVEALTQQGLSITEYNHVVAAADEDPALKQRLLAAAQAE